VVLQILAFYAALRGFASGIVELYKGIGRPRMALVLSAFRLCVVVPSVLVGLRWGIAGVAWAQTLTTLVVALTMQGMVGRTLSFPATAQIRQLIPGLALGAGVALGASAAYLIPAPDPAQLLVGLGAGGVLGAASLWVFDRSFVTEMRGLFAREREQEVAL
jgi:O-antigen/teichoic acid export membrane protein